MKDRNMKNNKTVFERTHYISNVANIPASVHFAVVQESQIHHDDGYGGSTYTSTLTYICFDDEEALNAWILKEKESMSYKKPYKVLHVNPNVSVDINVQVSVNVKVG